MAITRVMHRYLPAARSLPSLQLSQLTRFSRERIAGVTTTTFTLFNEPVEPWTLELNGRTLDRDSSPAEYSVSGKTVTLSRAAVAADVLVFSAHFRSA